MNSRRMSPSKANLLASAMGSGRKAGGNRPTDFGDNLISNDDLVRIKSTMVQQSTANSPTELVLQIGRLRPDERSSDLLHSKVTDFFHRKGSTSLNKWQINGVVRKVLVNRVALTHDDIASLEKEIRRKETGLPGSKMSPVSSSTIKFRNVDVKNGGSSPLAANASRFVHQKRMSMDEQNDYTRINRNMSPISINQPNINDSILDELNVSNNRQQMRGSNNVPMAQMAGNQMRMSGASGLGQQMERKRAQAASALDNPYSNISTMKNTPVKEQSGNGRTSVGILPSLGPPIDGLPSLAEYGNNPHSNAHDSSLLQLKNKRTNRLVEEQNKMPRHKSSLQKQFHTEVISPVKQTPFVKLDYSMDIGGTSSPPKDHLQQVDQKKRFAANLAKKQTGYTLSSLPGGASGAKRTSQFRTVGTNSPIAHVNKGSSSAANRNGKSALNIREKPLVGQHRNSSLNTDQNNNYMSANQIAYGQKIPMVNQKELKYVLFKPETKQFDTEDA